MQRISKGDIIYVVDKETLLASPATKLIAKALTNPSFKVTRANYYELAQLELIGSNAKDNRVLWSLEQIEASMANGSIVVSHKLPTLPKQTTKTFKVLQFISEQKDGATFTDIQRFVCQLNGVDFDQREYQKWSGHTVRLNRGYYSTNIARWRKVYLTKKDKKYFLREELLNEMSTIIAKRQPTQVSGFTPLVVPAKLQAKILDGAKMDNTKTSDVAKQAEPQVDEVAIEVSRLMAIETTHAERLAMLNKQMDELKLQIQMANTSRLLNKEKLKKILVHCGMFKRHPARDSLIF